MFGFKGRRGEDQGRFKDLTERRKERKKRERSTGEPGTSEGVPAWVQQHEDAMTEEKTAGEGLETPQECHEGLAWTPPKG